MIEKITHESLVEQVSLESGFDLDTSRNFLTELFGLIGERAVQKSETQIRNFGTFVTRYHAQKVGTNPQSREPLTIPAHFALHFHPSQKLVSTVNQAQGYLSRDDISTDIHLGIKQYFFIALLAFFTVSMLFLFPNPTLSKKKELGTIVYVTVPHGVHDVSGQLLPVTGKAAFGETAADKGIADHHSGIYGLAPEQASENIVKPSIGISSKLTTLEQTLYHIKKGDSLSIIAKRYYGHAEYWPVIYQENQDGISDPDRIQIGAVIKIPNIDAPQTREDKARFGGSYLNVYKVYRELSKIDAARWTLWMGVTKIDGCLLEEYVDRIMESDLRAVRRFLACSIPNGVSQDRR